MNFIFLST